MKKISLFGSTGSIGTNTIEYCTWGQTVYSFEPTPELYNSMLNNVQLNQTNIDTYRWDDNTSMNLTAKLQTFQCAPFHRLA
jgi:1-deoxy-D-xylulose 5-phosphate reductoisomerase